ncbi:shikimate kinase [Kordia zhangzhouensis]|uniref:shikimate kinase n=1 Tax=Kordia zhangzhouensis TaxID=1620405 RepID=UPI000629B8F7|nr:shikimate kinase [Kordia zhangzhouensis]
MKETTIILLGYMASGKSAVSKLLGKEIALPVIDLDDYIEESEKKSISEIFAEKGEIYFRKKEHEYLQEILQKNKPCVVSLGGGTPCYANNMELIEQYTTQTFYLQTSIAEIIKRVKDEKEKRPLIKDIETKDLPEFIGKHLFERANFYQKSTYSIITDGKTIREIVVEIQKKLN